MDSSATGKLATMPTFTGYLYMSYDYGLTWTAGTILKSWKFVKMNLSGQYQLATTAAEYVYLTSNFGASWGAITSIGTNNWEVPAVSASGQYQSVCGGTTLIYSSSNYGVTWTSMTPSVGTTYASIAMSGSGQYRICKSGSISILSSDYGVTWRANTSGTVERPRMSYSGEYVGGALGGTVYVSRDYGDIFIVTNSPFLSGGTGDNRHVMSATAQYTLIAGATNTITSYSQSRLPTILPIRINNVTAITGNISSLLVSSINMMPIYSTLLFQDTFELNGRTAGTSLASTTGAHVVGYSSNALDGVTQGWVSTFGATSIGIQIGFALGLAVSTNCSIDYINRNVNTVFEFRFNYGIANPRSMGIQLQTSTGIGFTVGGYGAGPPYPYAATGPDGVVLSPLVSPLIFDGIATTGDTIRIIRTTRSADVYIGRNNYYTRLFWYSGNTYTFTNRITITMYYNPVSFSALTYFREIPYPLIAGTTLNNSSIQSFDVSAVTGSIDTLTVNTVSAVTGSIPTLTVNTINTPLYGYSLVTNGSQLNTTPSDSGRTFLLGIANSQSATVWLPSTSLISQGWTCKIVNMNTSGTGSNANIYVSSSQLLIYGQAPSGRSTFAHINVNGTTSVTNTYTKYVNIVYDGSNYYAIP